MANFLRWGNFALGVGKFTKSFFHGAVDELLYSDSEMTMHCDKAKVLEKCKPWDQHLTPNSIKNLGKSIQKKNYLNAREAIKSWTKTTAAPWCIYALLEAVVLMWTRCPTIILYLDVRIWIKDPTDHLVKWHSQTLVTDFCRILFDLDNSQSRLKKK